MTAFDPHLKLRCLSGRLCDCAWLLDHAHDPAEVVRLPRELAAGRPEALPYLPRHRPA
jgi:hypothetical protein